MRVENYELSCLLFICLYGAAAVKGQEMTSGHTKLGLPLYESPIVNPSCHALRTHANSHTHFFPAPDFQAASS